MDPEFWKSRWAAQQIGFHQTQTNVYLERYLGRLTGGARSRVLVPLCGKSEVLASLAGQGHPVLGVEVVDQAVRAFFAEHALEPTRTVSGKLERFAADKVEILRADFFDVTRADVGQVSGV